MHWHWPRVPKKPKETAAERHKRWKRIAKQIAEFLAEWWRKHPY